jgi:glycosyltransferase involved in cell wall biosynthesis
MVLFLHNRYRTTGGEERVVADLLALVREHLGEHAELLARDSAGLGRARAAAGLVWGGLDARDVERAVRLGHARVVHAHNLHPAFGWRALAAGRAAGARVVLHLHQYRLVCAIGVCFTRGEECTRCHARDTSPGVRLNCRGSHAESLAYGVSLGLWQRRLVEQADAVIVPSEFARERLRELGAPLDWDRVHVVPPPVAVPDEAAPPAETGPAAALPAEALPAAPFALVVSRLAPEKGVDVAIEACRVAGLPLVVAGDGPQAPALRRLASEPGHDVRFLGAVTPAELAGLRARASVAVVPSRSAETFGLAAAEAMAAGLPVAASRVGALPELLGDESLAAPGDAAALADVIGRLSGDRAAGERGRARVAAACSPAGVAARLASVYDGGRSHAQGRGQAST